MLNQCNFIGNLGKDPEIRALQNGDEVANFSIACTKKWKSKEGERKEKTDWVNIVVFGNLVNVVKNYLKKGSKVFISGELQTRKWQDQSGADRYSTEVVLQGFNGTLTMLGSKGGDSSSSPSATHSDSDYGSQQTPPELDDEIPF